MKRSRAIKMGHLQKLYRTGWASTSSVTTMNNVFEVSDRITQKKWNQQRCGGQLGIGSNNVVSLNVPVQVSIGEISTSSIAAGLYHSLCILSNGISFHFQARICLCTSPSINSGPSCLQGISIASGSSYTTQCSNGYTFNTTSVTTTWLTIIIIISSSTVWQLKHFQTCPW